jgi:hypothetical protein
MCAALPIPSCAHFDDGDTLEHVAPIDALARFLDAMPDDAHDDADQEGQVDQVDQVDQEDHEAERAQLGILAAQTRDEHDVVELFARALDDALVADALFDPWHLLLAPCALHSPHADARLAVDDAGFERACEAWYDDDDEDDDMAKVADERC